MAGTPHLSIVADIGGTNTRVAIAEGMRLREGSIRRYRNAEFAGLETILRTYVTETGAACEGACVAAAGPVRDGVAEMTNLSWVIDGDQLHRATGARRVAILNDLQAQGHALGHIAPENLATVIDGPDDPAAAKLVIGAGTGFNAAPVHETPWGRHVAASECGHAGMPVRSESDLRLARFVETAHGFPGVEDVLAGRGLERLYAFTAAAAGHPAELTAAEIMAAIDRADPLALETGRLYARLLGGEVGNLALIHLPFGGIYLCGGVARAFTAHLSAFGFAEAFRDKGRFSGFMGNFRVQVIEDDYAALIGCAAHLGQIARADG
ncbi:ROK family protein [Aliigemmobacter aestuarii]|uniref:ROK family protein n=1 Tax=Aliigemmobacter aestuarii TaxID=1445661 RepID=A0A4S3MLE9_9RHOB|nr:glucokinase [Gemmobacter aestuarii]THD82996.1 ROK family protein [Gemmobacter aestuarii]